MEGEEKVPEGAAKEERKPLSLGDSGDVYQVCFAFIESVSDIFVGASAGELSSEEAEERMAQVSEWLTAALLGRVPGIDAKEGWTGAPLARSLVAVLANEISRLPREAQEELSSVDGVVMLSSMCFMHEVQETLSGINRLSEEEAEKGLEAQGRAIHDLCLKWAGRFVGTAKPAIILPDGVR